MKRSGQLGLGFFLRRRLFKSGNNRKLNQQDYGIEVNSKTVAIDRRLQFVACVVKPWL